MKHFFLFSLMLVALSATAQEFKPFKFNISLGYAKPSGPGASGGVMFSVEPKYGLSDQIDIGIRAELAVMARAYTINGQDADGEIKGAGSYLLTGTYLLSQTNFRPYVGAGRGYILDSQRHIFYEQWVDNQQRCRGRRDEIGRYGPGGVQGRPLQLRAGV